MARISDWFRLMPYTVIVEGCSTMDSYGNKTYQSCTSYRAAIQGPTKFLFRDTNSERVSSQTVYIGSAAAITTQDRITLPTPFEIAQPPILQVQRESDQRGAMFTKVLLG